MSPSPSVAYCSLAISAYSSMVSWATVSRSVSVCSIASAASPPALPPSMVTVGTRDSAVMYVTPSSSTVLVWDSKVTEALSAPPCSSSPEFPGVTSGSPPDCGLGLAFSPPLSPQAASAKTMQNAIMAAKIRFFISITSLGQENVLTGSPRLRI